MKSFKSHPLVFGTIILTITGLISRLIGFFYRMYLSRIFGEEGMGLYQLLGPVLSLSYCFCAVGYQTAISKLIAEKTARDKKASLSPLWAGFSIAMPLSLLCNLIIFRYAEDIAFFFLQESRTASLLKILSFSIPLSTVHSCVNGYFYGSKKTSVPAISQLIEQLTRVGCVFFLNLFYQSQGKTPSIKIAVIGLTVGEFTSMLFSFLSISLQKSVKIKYPLCSLYKGILYMALPLTANRMVLSILQSIESVSIPTRLRQYGYDTQTALSIYGVLTGMALPFIFFPNALTSSVSILLLPTISENVAVGNHHAVKDASLKTIKYCTALGIFCMLLFVCFGKMAGMLCFHSELAGYFITTLGFICPFMYLDTTLSGILQGLGKVGQIFIINVASLLLRLIFVFCFIPQIGIKGYLWGILVSQILHCTLYCICLLKSMRFKE